MNKHYDEMNKHYEPLMEYLEYLEKVEDRRSKVLRKYIECIEYSANDGWDVYDCYLDDEDNNDLAEILELLNQVLTRNGVAAEEFEAVPAGYRVKFDGIWH